jgi:hypothetical protein
MTSGDENRLVTWNSQKITPRQWDDIRRRYQEGETAASLAEEFGVRPHTIWQRVGKR